MELAMREAAAAHAAAAASYISIREFQPDLNCMQQVAQIAGSSESAIVGIHGGTLLGVVRSSMSGATGATLHLADWSTGLFTGTDRLRLCSYQSLRRAAAIFCDLSAHSFSSS